jgi:hypothetical protein
MSSAEAVTELAGFIAVIAASRNHGPEQTLLTGEPDIGH